MSGCGRRQASLRLAPLPPPLRLVRHISRAQNTGERISGIEPEQTLLARQ